MSENVPILVASCPHCRAEKVTFTVFGRHPVDTGGLGCPLVAIGALCRNCNHPISALYEWHDVEDHTGFAAKLAEFTKSNGALDSAYLKRQQIWPEAPALNIPVHLPDEVAKAFRQAETNYATPDCNEAAAILYRRSLELALKHVHPNIGNGLADSIRKLVASNDLPKSIGEWANHVRLIGNNGAHDVSGVSRDDVDDARNFVDMTLRYLMSMPAQIAERQNRKPPKAAASPRKVVATSAPTPPRGRRR